MREGVLPGELELARRIQKGLLPRGFPRVPTLEFDAWQETAEATGGDYYDVMLAPGGSVDLIVGDVSGHGIASALLMSALRAYLRALRLGESNPERLVERLDRLITPDLPQDGFISLVLCRISPDGTACYVSAGHHPPLVYRPARDAFDRHQATDLVLGVDPGASYAAHEIAPLHRGDVVVLVTDGLYEAASPQGELLGVESVREAIRAAASEGASGVVESLRALAFGHAERLELEDDVTLLVAART